MAIEVLTGSIRYRDENGVLKTADVLRGQTGKSAYQYARESGFIDSSVTEQDFAAACGRVYEELERIRQAGVTLQSLGAAEASLRQQANRVSQINTEFGELREQLLEDISKTGQALTDAGSATQTFDALNAQLDQLIPELQTLQAKLKNIRIVQTEFNQQDAISFDVNDVGTGYLINVGLPDLEHVLRSSQSNLRLEYGNTEFITANMSYTSFNAPVQFDQEFGANTIPMFFYRITAETDDGTEFTFFSQGLSDVNEHEATVRVHQTTKANNTSNIHYTVTWFAVGTTTDAEEIPPEEPEEEEEPEETTEP